MWWFSCVLVIFEVDVFRVRSVRVQGAQGKRFRAIGLRDFKLGKVDHMLFRGSS